MKTISASISILMLTHIVIVHSTLLPRWASQPAQGPRALLPSNTESETQVNTWIQNVAAERSAFTCDGSFVKSWHSDCDILKNREEDRMRLAAALTICEVEKAAGLKVPQECTDWMRSPSIPVSICVEAFARSPQFWSSYVAFARDIVKMCSSLSRWQDTAIIKNLYRNMTSMQSDFLKGILQESENRLARDSEEQKKHQQRQKTTDTAINNLENTTELLKRVASSQEQLQAQMLSTIAKAVEEARQQQLVANNVTSAMTAALPIISAHLEANLGNHAMHLRDTAAEVTRTQTRLLQQQLHEHDVTLHNLMFQLVERLSGMYNIVSAQLSELTQNISLVGQHVENQAMQLDRISRESQNLATLLVTLQSKGVEILSIAEQQEMTIQATAAQQVELTDSLNRSAIEVAQRLNSIMIPSVWSQMGLPFLSTLMSVSYHLTPRVFAAFSPRALSKAALSAAIACAVYRHPLGMVALMPVFMSPFPYFRAALRGSRTLPQLSPPWRGKSAESFFALA